MAWDCPTCGLVNDDVATTCDCGYKIGDREYKIEEGNTKPSLQPPSALNWLFCIVVLLVGVVSLGLYTFSSLYGTTAENELTLVTGVAKNVRLTEIPGRFGAKSQVATFSVGNYQTEYGSGSPKYDAVLAAIRSGKPVQLWVSTKKETLFPRAGWVPLYKLSMQGEPVVTYAEVIENKEDDSQSTLIVGGALLGLGLIGTCRCFYNRGRFKAGA